LSGLFQGTSAQPRSSARMKTIFGLVVVSLEVAE
jgi:hypothetical protein